MTTPELKTAKILVTPRSYGQHDPALWDELETRVGEVVRNPKGQPLSSDELVGLLAGCDGFIAGVDEIDRNALEASKRLKVVSRYGVGVENVDLGAAEELGIIVTNTPAANAASVAELALGLIFSLTRNIPQAVEGTKMGHWPRIRGLSLEGKTVGIIGLGAIGKQLVKRLAGFQCQILAYDLYPDEAFAAENQVALAPFEEVISKADILSIHLPLTPETKGLIDENTISMMKMGAYLVNTSRGGLVDEEALLAGLESGHLAGAGLDVLAKEPPTPDHPLLQAPNVMVTPHMGAHTDGATNAMGWGALNDCLAVLSGKVPLNRVI
jgi:D-3-phosphoglycerate dehydrogenase